MADSHQDQQDEDLVLSFFPDPPPFYRKFTTENIERLKEIEGEANPKDDNDSTLTSKLTLEQILALPNDLRYLVPPEPPADDAEFSVFGVPTKAKGGDVFTKHMEFTRHRMMEEGVLEDWTYEQLYPSADDAPSTGTTTIAATLDRQKVLFRLLRSLLLHYMSILGILATDPVSPAKTAKIGETLTMVMNMHALINEYRPHQARETLIEKMEAHVIRKKAEIEGVKLMAQNVQSVLDGFATEFSGVEPKDVIPNGTKAGEDLGSYEVSVGQYSQHVWAEMNELLEQ